MSPPLTSLFLLSPHIAPIILTSSSRKRNAQGAKRPRLRQSARAGDRERSNEPYGQRTGGRGRVLSSVQQQGYFCAGPCLGYLTKLLASIPALRIASGVADLHGFAEWSWVDASSP
ncbi:short chain dehydrogenase [Diplocarpon rosae]|nr:short chain dehydrogenase [Diplocarpon rosae]